MTRLIFTDEARQDLLGIRQYTQNKWGISQAQAYICELRTTLKRLQEWPLIGVDRSDELGAGIYSFPHVSHMIYYTQQGDDLVILALLHQSMIPARHLDQRH